MKRGGKVPAVAGLALFALATVCIPAIAIAGAIGGTIAAMAQRPRVRR